VDCDWFSNDELPPLPSFPDRTASSGGCLPDGRGTGRAETRGTAWQLWLPGADHFPQVGPPVGGNGSQQGQRNAREHCRGACFTTVAAWLRLAGDRSPGNDAGPSGDGPRVRPQAFRGVAITCCSIRAAPGSGDPGALKPKFTHRIFRFNQRPGRITRGTGIRPGLSRFRNGIDTGQSLRLPNSDPASLPSAWTCC